MGHGSLSDALTKVRYEASVVPHQEYDYSFANLLSGGMIPLKHLDFET